MRKIREILRLRADGKSQRLIALSVGIGQSTVGDTLTRARLAVDHLRDPEVRTPEKWPAQARAYLHAAARLQREDSGLRP